jgi:light-regulated signal transduction histidine kinase (bacteriophytochrome)
VARSVVDELRGREPQRDVEVSISGSMPVNGDVGLLKIVLENLIGNAWKFTGRRAHAKIDCEPVDTPAGRAFVVRDNGAGFDMAYADKLFGVFQRLHGQQEFPGTGIGLATVQRIVERHGGKVWAQATLGEGASFYFTL